MIPLFVECAGKRVVVFGGGEVAARKAGHFSREADVLVVSRTFTPSVKALPVQLQVLNTREANDADLGLLIAPAFLVIGALSDKAENDRIGALCKEHGVLFNNADGTPGDVVIPAISTGEFYTIAVSTGSQSPAVSRFIRQEIEKSYPALDAMVLLQHRLREMLKEGNTTPETRRRILWEVLRDKTVWTLLSESPERAWERVKERYLHE
ncbi:bifunctional precorrin-2 dehydrogenase/sirohydrochlorin ferrochelatase [Methanoregula sp.]|uniref:precorrin-2 dehydrogenase/sirohydrochlorin ferrochelatase family protein n=1 Tax=Methanoregula sp. TaxID=2052170 RepID=UPI002C7CC042|nr:bifunctional precorrin-2 dehydrogenase/sirohydrochlorin ferrochelatase [Methanoregula sp.]HVP96029.1 bifunctional precorrin-2 dehydrogenase/sirohydrochlorin ferrochelatase [Methanoregula sp.]